MPHSAVRNSGALTIESIMWGSVARVMAGGTPGDGVVVARAPPQAARAAMKGTEAVLLRMDIDGPRGGWLGSILRSTGVHRESSSRDDGSEEGSLQPGQVTPQPAQL